MQSEAQYAPEQQSGRLVARLIPGDTYMTPEGLWTYIGLGIWCWFEDERGNVFSRSNDEVRQMMVGGSLKPTDAAD